MSWPLFSRTPDLPAAGGFIYRIRNRMTGDSYVGGTANLRARLTGHRTRLRKGTHHARALLKNYWEYGSAAFDVELLETIPRKRFKRGAAHFTIHPCEAGWSERLKPSLNTMLPVVDTGIVWWRCPVDIVRARTAKAKRTRNAKKRKRMLAVLGLEIRPKE